jgi:hypothetical protein
MYKILEKPSVCNSLWLFHPQNVNGGTYTNWSVEIAVRSGGGPTNAFSDRSLHSITWH